MTPESRVSAAAYGAKMKKLIIPFYMLSLHADIVVQKRLQTPSRE
jgi:hypothetical protein